MVRIEIHICETMCIGKASPVLPEFGFDINGPLEHLPRIDIVLDAMDLLPGPVMLAHKRNAQGGSNRVCYLFLNIKDILQLTDLRTLPWSTDFTLSFLPIS